ncbi:MULTISPECIES: hypothetical protein [unclassified Beijerinckia]|uniref:hypothetical protein n=1 Tax=unclassified Beijerinckia TaxID=2638183 RepID=UPI000895DFBE|nr:MULTISPECIES: hypothetical protein [unclassified Beijerinckia]MDH7797900.1 hypothetical protein [Beijerinckia sp. GAS462]SED02261.1 hypothetical protein SAMN05443249_4192 [Beijerinckia sp. 28-YEA-48]
MRIAAFIVTGVLACGLTACVLLTPQAALAQRSPTDCDKLTNDDAYNKCLASFGPKRGQHVPSGSTAYPDAVDAPPRAGASTAPNARSVREGSGTRARRASGRRNLGYRGLRGNGSTVVVTQLKGGRLRFQIVMPQRR